jgi:chromatin segregation and condensation protein Rec8/ScpA/Scc1 (kleisin family)
VTSDAPGTFHVDLPIFAGTIDDLCRRVTQKEFTPEGLPCAAIALQLSAYLRAKAMGQKTGVGPGFLTDESRGEHDVTSDKRSSTIFGLDLDEAGYLITSVSRLLALKSAQLIVQPLDDATDELISSRSGRLLERAALGGAVAHLSAREGSECFAPIAAPHLVERQLEPRSPSALARTWTELQHRAARASARVAVPGFVRLETAVSGLIRRLRAQARTSLGKLLCGADRHEAVVHFLAVLELVRRRQAVADQSDIFADIVVEYVERGAEEAFRAG